MRTGGSFISGTRVFLRSRLRNGGYLYTEVVGVRGTEGPRGSTGISVNYESAVHIARV